VSTACAHHEASAAISGAVSGVSPSGSSPASPAGMAHLGSVLIIAAVCTVVMATASHTPDLHSQHDPTASHEVPPTAHMSREERVRKAKTQQPSQRHRNSDGSLKSHKEIWEQRFASHGDSPFRTKEELEARDAYKAQHKKDKAAKHERHANHRRKRVAEGMQDQEIDTEISHMEMRDTYALMHQQAHEFKTRHDASADKVERKRLRALHKSHQKKLLKLKQEMQDHGIHHSEDDAVKLKEDL